MPHATSGDCLLPREDMERVVICADTEMGMELRMVVLLVVMSVCEMNKS